MPNFDSLYQFIEDKRRLASYTYNDSGIRTSKTVNGATTNYYLDGDDVVTEITGSSRIDYYYDDNGDLFGFKYNGSEYYYVRNGQNDIIGILDANGNKVVSYSYDSWGKLLSTTGSLASTVGAVNPYRYRGYRYDTETGLYYLGSRYYNPNTGRFLNIDEFISTGSGLLGYNMFAYGNNNSINTMDSNGYRAIADDGTGAWVYRTNTGKVFAYVGKKKSHNLLQIAKNSFNAEVRYGMGIGGKGEFLGRNGDAEAASGQILGYNGKNGVYSDWGGWAQLDVNLFKKIQIGASIKKLASEESTRKSGWAFAPDAKTEGQVGLHAGKYVLGYSNTPNDWVISIGGGGYLFVGGEAEVSLNLSEFVREISSD